jgi:hypothetical protein
MNVKNRTARVGAILIAVCIICLFSSQVVAEDFTFRIPIEFKNLDKDYSRYQVIIGVYKSTNFVVQNQIAQSQGQAAIDSADYRHTMVIEFDRLGGMDPLLAKYYSISLLLFKKSANRFINIKDAGIFGGPEMLDPSKPFRVQIQEEIK